MELDFKEPILGDYLVKTINVRNFGAKGDGDTDDRVSIQAAIDALYKSPLVDKPSMYKEGGIVYFPPGNYKITKTIRIDKSGIYLVGDTPTTAYLCPAGDLVDGKIQFDGKLSGNAVFEFSYFTGANGTGQRTQIANIGMRHLGIDMRFVDKTTAVRILRPYNSCILEDIMFFNIRGKAIEAVSNTEDKPFNDKNLVGQGLVMRDIHIDNTTTLDNRRNKMSLDSGMPEDATLPVIHLENLNESSLTNVKILACGKKGDREGTYILTDGVTSNALAPRHGLLLQGCQGITVKECAFAQFSKAAIKIERGTFGKQVENLYTFIHENTFEENSETGVTIDGSTTSGDISRKGVGKIVISENRFLGNLPLRYSHWLNHCDLVTIRDRGNIYIGEGALNTTIDTVDLNTAISEKIDGRTTYSLQPKIEDNGVRTVIMGKEYLTDGANVSNIYAIKTRLTAKRFSLPVIEKQELYPDNEVSVEGDIALLREEREKGTKIVIFKTLENGSLGWVDMAGNSIFSGEITSAVLSGNSIIGTFTGDIHTFQVTTVFNDGTVLTKVGGTLDKNGNFSFYYPKPSNFQNVVSLKVDGLDKGRNKITEFSFPHKLQILPEYNIGDSFITGNYFLIKSLRLVVESTDGEERIEYLGGDLDSKTENFKYYALGKINNQPLKTFILEGMDANGEVAVRINVLTREVL